MPKITQLERQRIILMDQQNVSQTAISQKLGISRCGVQAIIKKFKETGKLEDRKRSGRPKKLSKSDVKYLKVSLSRNGKKSNKVLAQELRNASGPSVHPSTVRRSLIRNGLNGTVAAEMPSTEEGDEEGVAQTCNIKEEPDLGLDKSHGE